MEKLGKRATKALVIQTLGFFSGLISRFRYYLLVFTIELVELSKFLLIRLLLKNVTPTHSTHHTGQFRTDYDLLIVKLK